MSITKEKTAELVKEYGRNDKDSGSSEAQIAILTERINTITGHLKSNKKDHSGRRGLIAMVSRRRKLLDYVRKQNNDNYLSIIKKLDIRK
jgi:small subunit ribosomal protein S15|tara:strand:+ start:756 stop:1025 length:270 start_codon:yes stop_codon:yes gene_type:complete